MITSNTAICISWYQKQFYIIYIINDAPSNDPKVNDLLTLTLTLVLNLAFSDSVAAGALCLTNTPLFL